MTETRTMPSIMETAQVRRARINLRLTSWALNVCAAAVAGYVAMVVFRFLQTA